MIFRNEKKPNRSNAIVEPNPVQLEEEQEKTDDNGTYVTLYPDRLTLQDITTMAEVFVETQRLVHEQGETVGKND